MGVDQHILQGADQAPLGVHRSVFGRQPQLRDQLVQGDGQRAGDAVGGLSRQRAAVADHARQASGGLGVDGKEVGQLAVAAASLLLGHEAVQAARLVGQVGNGVVDGDQVGIDQVEARAGVRV